jgi:hypothetical protein|nr:MAG TPA: Portal protein, Proximal tail tube, phi29, mature virion, VIRUS.3A [Bacteriophage sp.]
MAASDYMPTGFPDFSSQDAVNEWTGRDKWDAVYTVTLGELIDKGVFDWSLDILDWSAAAYSAEQYTRVCTYFIERFRFREIGIEPFYEWATMLHRKLVYELMPKYRNLYRYLDDEFDPAQISDRYRKRRAIGSDYPETMLSGNSDYASSGQDEESEEIERGNLQDAYNAYVAGYQTIDEHLLDELESMFIGLYTASIDGM